MGVWAQRLDIKTVETFRKSLERTNNINLTTYRLDVFDDFVNYWNIEYFINPNFVWDLSKIYDKLPGLYDLADHINAFVDKEGRCFLFLQPYDYTNPEKFCKENDIFKYVDFKNGGYHHEKTYCIVISGDFLSYVEKNIEENSTWQNRTPDSERESYIISVY